jgi:hypothetical protein
MSTTVFYTVLSGVITYVLGQIVVKLIIDPVQEMKKLIGRIAHSLTEHANVYLNPGVGPPEILDSTAIFLRQLSAELEAQIYLVPLYETTRRIFGLPSKDDVLKAAGALLGLSNSVRRAGPRTAESNAEREQVIKDSLGIYTPPGQRHVKHEE